MAPQASRAQSLSSSIHSGGSGGSDAPTDASTSPPPTDRNQPVECPQTDIQAAFNKINAYLAREKAPSDVRAALKTLHAASVRRVEPNTTEKAIQSLQHAVQQIANRLDEASKAPTDSQRAQSATYAAVVSQGL